MTEDDWRWHMYDTVSIGRVALLAFISHPYRSRVPTGLVTRMRFITCVVKHHEQLSRYVICSYFIPRLSTGTDSTTYELSLSISVFLFRGQRRAKSTNEHSEDNL